MQSKSNYYWLLIFIPLVFVIWFLKNKSENKPLRSLPYYGPKNALKINDTLYHQVSAFTFTDQYGHVVTEEAVRDKIYVTEFFFTTCHSICPIMNENMKRVYASLENKDEVLILSHTVDPETDSVSVMKAYADRHGVNNRKWLFLTGSKQQLYAIARTGYLLDANEGNGGEEDFIHTQNFALIDKDRHVRGYYDGTDSVEVVRLLGDIELLRQEYDYNKKRTN
jgi:protein SCO1